jgi:hypothetical protein
MAITTNRDRYVASHTTDDIWRALRDEAARREISLSRLIHELMREGLRRRGYTVSGSEYRVVR